MRHCLIMPLFVLTIVLCGCAGTLRNDELQQVAKDWSYVIRASQVIPVYPPNEDLQPGDVLLVSTPIDEQVKVYEEKGFLPLDQMFVRLHSLEFGEPWKGVYNDFYNGRYGTDGDVNTPGQWQKQKEGWQNAPRASFPSYSFSVQTGSGLNLAIPISGVPLALGLMNSGKASGSVTLSKVSTYGLDNYRMNRIVSAWTRQNRALLRNYEPYNGKQHFLRVVTRVYVVGAVDVTIHNDEATSAEAKVGADRPVKLLGIDAQKPDANYTGAMTEINKLADKVAPGGALKFVSASSRAVTMKEDFPSPLVVGYVGFDLPIELGGRTGAPISTLAQLTDQKPIPAKFGTDSVYRLAVLNLLYSALTQIISKPSTTAEKIDANRLKSELDGLAQDLPDTYPFTLIELDEDGNIKTNVEKESAIAGNKVPNDDFTNVTDYVSEALTTIESIESHLANAPMETPEQVTAANAWRAPLGTAREAFAHGAQILKGNPALLEAIDFVFLEN